ncbi:MAG: hypothetical protein Q9204_001378 [Flavoplaca sp. TL-2023a]
MTSLRRNFGLGEPVRRGMELKIAREGEWRPMALGVSAGVSGDILVGRDNEITWEDVYTVFEDALYRTFARSITPIHAANHQKKSADVIASCA